jgi:hypothetical protein
MSRRKTPTTIVIKIGYTHLAIPFTLERMAALEDLMSNHVAVSIGWNNDLAALNPKDAKDFSVQILALAIPEWVEPETDDENNANEQE